MNFFKIFQIKILIKRFFKLPISFLSEKYIFIKTKLHYGRIKRISNRKLKQNFIEKIYICHHSPLKERKLKLNSIIKEFKTDLEWVEKFLPDEIEDSYSRFVNIEKLKINVNLPGIDEYHYVYHKNAGRKVTISEYSLYLKMKYCFEDQIKNQYANIIIFEDDVLLDKNVENYLNICAFEFISHIPKLDCLMLGTAFNFKSKFIKPNNFIHFGKNQLTRCTHAMMFSLNAAKIIHKNLNRVNWPIDYKLNEIIIKESLKVAWAEPGLYQSSLLTKNGSSIIKEFD